MQDLQLDILCAHVISAYCVAGRFAFSSGNEDFREAKIPIRHYSGRIALFESIGLGFVHASSLDLDTYYFRQD